jgi:hypothetical protein
MTSVHATIENVSRRGFLQGLFATGGLVVAAEFVPSGALFAAYATGAAKMAGGVVSDPHVFVSIDPKWSCDDRRAPRRNGNRRAHQLADGSR